MTKKSTVIAFAAVILTASAFGFKGLAFAEEKQNATASSWKSSQKHIKEYLQQAPGVVGTVEAINGDTLTISSKNDTTYMIDASQAAILKNRNTLIHTTDIKIGDTVLAQGTVTGSTVIASTVFDGKILVSKQKGKKNKQRS